MTQDTEQQNVACNQISSYDRHVFYGCHGPNGQSRTCNPKVVGSSLRFGRVCREYPTAPGVCVCSLLCVYTWMGSIQSTNSEYGSPYLATRHFTSRCAYAQTIKKSAT